VTTEFNTLFETVLSVSEKVDPLKLNQTLAAAAEALDGLGERFGQSIIHGNEILTDLNPQLPQIRRDTKLLADLGGVYADAAPDLFDGLENAVTTAQTFNEQQANLDQALLASIGVGNTGSDIFERGGPYLLRGAEDLIPTAERSTNTVRRCSARSATTTTSNPSSPGLSGQRTVTQAWASAPSSAPAIPTSIPTTCRG
jgi:phospholipid/cholesterol/gamma-HCH transport system substrate-binding protein